MATLPASIPQEEGPIDCGICLEALSKKRSLKLSCNHVFHRTCIHGWFDSKESFTDNSCCLCRKNDPESVHVRSFPFENEDRYVDRLRELFRLDEGLAEIKEEQQNLLRFCNERAEELHKAQVEATSHEWIRDIFQEYVKSYTRLEECSNLITVLEKSRTDDMEFAEALEAVRHLLHDTADPKYRNDLVSAMRRRRASSSSSSSSSESSSSSSSSFSTSSSSSDSSYEAPPAHLRGTSTDASSSSVPSRRVASRRRGSSASSYSSSSSSSSSDRRRRRRAAAASDASRRRRARNGASSSSEHSYNSTSSVSPGPSGAQAERVTFTPAADFLGQSPSTPRIAGFVERQSAAGTFLSAIIAYPNPAFAPGASSSAASTSNAARSSSLTSRASASGQPTAIAASAPSSTRASRPPSSAQSAARGGRAVPGGHDNAGSSSTVPRRGRRTTGPNEASGSSSRTTPATAASRRACTRTGGQRDNTATASTPSSTSASRRTRTTASTVASSTVAVAPGPSEQEIDNHEGPTTRRRTRLQMAGNETEPATRAKRRAP